MNISIMKGLGILLSGLLLSFAGSLFAQATGQIAGLVSDPTGSVVTNATIEVTNQDTGLVRKVTSGDNGFYTVPLVNPGTYSVKASMTGFSTLVRQGIEVSVNGTARADFILQLGQIAETVTTSATAPLVETSNSTLGIVIDEKKVVDLPLNGRNFAQLGTLLPGVVAPPTSLGGLNGNATPGGFGNATGSFNVNGMRNQSNNFMLDGAANNDSFNSGFVLRPPPDAIQEFKILTHSYAAEYGRNAGSVVNVVSKSGTNRWHGAAWEFNRDDSLQARNFFAITKPELKQHQFGGSLGGPLKQNKLFVFGYYEGFRNDQGTTANQVVLSADQRAGRFGSTNIRDPLNNNQPFPNNIIPPERISPIATRILDRYIPLPNSAANRVIRAPTQEDRRNQIGARVDYMINEKHSIFGRYMFGKSKAFDPLGGSNFSPSGNTAEAKLQDGTMSHTWLISPSVINVARGGVNRIDAQPTVTSGLPLSDLGFLYPQSNAAAAGLPFISLTGFFTTGDAQQPFANRINNVIAFSDDLTWIRGRHSFKFGGEIRRDQINVSYINRPNGDFLFNSQYTGNAAADFLLGYPIQFRQATGDPNLNGSSFTFSGYGQDEFRVSPRLTLSLGLRYELNQPFKEKLDHLAAFHPGQQSTRFPAAPTGLVYPGDANTPRGTYYTDTNNVAPRLAVVWDPTGKAQTSIRAAWGLFYDTIPGQGDFFQNGTLAPPFQPLTEINFPLQITSSQFANPLAGASGSAAFPANLTFIGWGPDFTTPVVQHYNLTIQQQLGSSFGLEVGYVGSKGDHLPMFIEVNPTTPVLTPTPTFGQRPFPAFALLRPTFSVAESWYNSLQASLRMRPWNGINMLASYTWSNAIDHVSGLNIGGESRPIQAATIGDEASFERVLAREKGPALFDARHRFVVSFGYELPALQTAAPLVRLIAGGWQLNGIVQAQTGFPLTVLEPNNISLTSQTNRPNLTCNPNEGAPNTVAQWFSTGCFQRLTTANNAGQLGNEGRNAVRGPGFTQTDLSLFKSFRFAEQHQVQFRFEAFNALNQARFGQPGNSLGTPTFGVITSASDGRIIQLALKYTF